jgi:hypothetical protein
MQSLNFDFNNINKYFEYVKNDEEFQYAEDEIQHITIDIFEDGIKNIEKINVIRSLTFMEEDTGIIHYLTLNGIHIQSLQMDRLYNVCLNKTFNEFNEIQFIVSKNVVAHLLNELQKGTTYIKLLYHDALKLAMSYIREKATYNLMYLNEKLEGENMFLIELVKKLGNEK